MAFDHRTYDNSDTGSGAESRRLRLPSQQIVSDGLVQAMKDGRRGIFLLGAESAGAGKSAILLAAVEAMECFPVWIRPDECALDSQMNPKRVVRIALRAMCEKSPEWFECLANHFLGRVIAVGLRAGLIPAHDAEAWARAIEESPDRYLSGPDGAELLIWLADGGRAEIRRQMVLRLMSSSNPVFDEVREASAWLEFFLSGRIADADATDWLARWIDLGDTSLSGEDVKFTRQTLALANSVHPVVCLLDQIDGVMGRPNLAREVAGMALDWMNCASMVVIAVNRDVWEAGFLPVLPEAWSARLSACLEWLGEMPVSEPEMFAKSPVLDSSSDFLVFSEEPSPISIVETRRDIFIDVGERLPFVTVESENAEDQRMSRVRWNTPEHVAWIGLAEPRNHTAWRAFFAGFAAMSADEGAVKLVVPIFDDESETVIRDYATRGGVDPSHPAISWLAVSRLTPAGWWRAMESRNRTMESFLAASPLWNAITEPVMETP